MAAPFAFAPSRFIFGTTRLGDCSLPLAERLQLAQEAMQAGVWFHTSRQYGDALAVLRQAFDAAPERVPPLIIKIGHNDFAELHASIRSQLEALGRDSLDVGQLCLGGAYAEDFRHGGALYGDLRRLKEEGLVRHFVMEVFPWTSLAPYEGWRAGHGRDVIDAFIFYFNPLQRFATNALWDYIQETNTPVIAMRTICGAPVHKLRDVPGAAWTPYLQQRAREVAPIFERSGVTDWTEFCFRFAFSFPQVLATVGSTGRSPHLKSLLQWGSQPALRPLPTETLAELQTLHRRWSDEVDALASPWTM